MGLILFIFTLLVISIIYEFIVMFIKEWISFYKSIGVIKSKGEV